MHETKNITISGTIAIFCWLYRVSDILKSHAHGIRNHTLSPRLVSQNAAAITPTIEIPNATPVLNI
ncbi:uncharacterized protein MTB313_0863 [Streptococcus pyogenes]|nr:uncharacterized protein MTB313_0863 [Streptococcus pyogenes]